MFPSIVSLSEKDNNNNSDCHFPINALFNCGIQIHDLDRSLNPNNPVISSCGTIMSPQEPLKIKKKRNLPRNPDPDAEVVALSPKTLLATNRFVCEVCQKGFQRDQNLQLHKRGHNLPWKLKQRNPKDIRKRAYICPDPTCVHHHPSRALGDLSGIKKHFCRKHGEKKWKCEKCSKIYAVPSDCKAHSKTCGTREYRCDCGTTFSRKDSLISHRAFCDALAEEATRISANNSLNHPPPPPVPPQQPPHHIQTLHPLFYFPPPPTYQHHFSGPSPNLVWDPLEIKSETLHLPTPSPLAPPSATYQPPLPPTHMLATALLQKAASFGSHPMSHVASTMVLPELIATRNFMGLTKENGVVDANMHGSEMLTCTGVVEYYDYDFALVKGQEGFGFRADLT